MARRASLDIYEDFSCSICLDVFTKPVSIPCGHNFCWDCITTHWDNSPVLKCPLCTEIILKRPELRVNTLVDDMATKVKNSAKERSCGPPEQAGNGDVLCGMCTQPSTAIKSCLVCLQSYCEKHLQPHQTKSALKKHKLIDPVEDLESRLCKKHDEPLELFCRADQVFICTSCKDSDHKTHAIVSLEEEAQIRKDKLGKQRTDMNQMIQARQQKIQEVRDTVDASGNNAAKALTYSVHVMTAVVDYINRSKAELTEVIKTKQAETEAEAEVIIKELKGEIVQIEQTNLQLNQVSLKNDAFTFLENVLPLTITLPQVKDWSDLTLNSNQFTVQDVLNKLEKTVVGEIRMLCDPDLKKMRCHAVDVTLDPDTAYPSLIVSEDGKQVTHGDRKRNLPNKPQRFDHVLNVVAKEGFSSGKFYYEVQVKDKTEWDLGVAHQSINRKGDIRISPNNGYWTIWLRKGNEFTANAGPAIRLNVREMPQKVGVYVDYEEGHVSFYDVDTRALIFSFTGCKFTEELFPFFSPGANDGGKNSAPLIITPVKNNS
ncbi:E3 ubiquitin-protein ligase TRIM21-like [Pagrus major]|uniref:E3 ubiquitin-protein ligase TRIM21-like n=1 Tax=Pagrus major TaxID=143350 RepID=UPI003CC8B2E7